MEMEGLRIYRVEYRVESTYGVFENNRIKHFLARNISHILKYIPGPLEHIVSIERLLDEETVYYINPQQEEK